jgi:hypothetical protein
LFGFGAVLAQDRISHKTLSDTPISGNEIRDMTNIQVIESNNAVHFDPVYSRTLTWGVHQITDRQTGYDLQSNASTQQLWQDPNNPDYLHAIFMNSQVAITPWADRTCLYFGSVDAGLTWFESGPVPSTTMSGYPAIYGKTDGSGIIMNHNAVFTQTRTSVMPDNSPFEYNFGNFNPGSVPGGNPIWPRFIVASNGDYVFGSSVNGADSFYVNIFTPGANTFRGYEGWDGNQAETYTFAISPTGKIGMAYIGQTTTGPPVSYENDGDVFLTESIDNGQTWTAPQKIFVRDHSNDTTWGAMRGINIKYFGEEPCIAFETAWQDFAGGTYRQGDANSLYFWSANVNGGVPMVMLDSSYTIWNPGGGANDVYVGVCRPVLGRSEDGNVLFLAFSVASGEVWPDPLTEQSPYFDGYFTFSTDGGESWTEYEKFTPDSPRYDWRHISIASIIPFDDVNGVYTVNLVCQGDTLPGSTVQVAAPMVVGVTAKYYHFSTDILFDGVNDDLLTVDNFSLDQNYPNPFNPSTKISYNLAERSNVTLTVYDVLGSEVASLVNTTQEAGVHSVTFDASALSSGLYIYKITAGNFTSSKKMMLLK